VQQLLQDGVLPEDITLLIMWSGIRRYDLYVDEKIAHKHLEHLVDRKSLRFCTFIDNSNQKKKWLHTTWDFKNSDMSSFDIIRDHDMGIIRTLEDILRVQWFLDKHNINYTMMTYMDIFSSESYIQKNYNLIRKKGLMKDSVPEAKHLWDMVDFDKFLFLKTKFSEYGGLMEFSMENKCGWLSPGDSHPSEAAHELFVDEVLLKNKTIMSNIN